MPEPRRERALQSLARFSSTSLDELLAPSHHAEIEQHTGLP
jgi:hypothetical protein